MKKLFFTLAFVFVASFGFASTEDEPLEELIINIENIEFDMVLKAISIDVEEYYGCNELCGDRTVFLAENSQSMDMDDLYNYFRACVNSCNNG